MFNLTIYKLAAIGLLLSNGINAEDQDLTPQLKPLIDCAKHVINYGVEDLNIDPFPEIKIEEFNLTTKIAMFVGSYNFTNIILKGISDFDMTATFGEDLKITFLFSINKIHLTTQYDFDSRLFEITDLLGSGIMDFKMAMDLDGVVDLKNGGFETMQVNPTVNPKFVITGLSIGERMSGLVGKQLDNIIRGIINTKEFSEVTSVIFRGVVKLLSEGSLLSPEILEELAEECNLVIEGFHGFSLKKGYNVRTDL